MQATQAVANHFHGRRGDRPSSLRPRYTAGRPAANRLVSTSAGRLSSRLSSAGRLTATQTPSSVALDAVDARHRRRIPSPERPPKPRRPVRRSGRRPSSACGAGVPPAKSARASRPADRSPAALPASAGNWMTIGSPQNAAAAARCRLRNRPISSASSGTNVDVFGRFDAARSALITASAGLARGEHDGGRAVVVGGQDVGLQAIFRAAGGQTAGKTQPAHQRRQAVAKNGKRRTLTPHRGEEQNLAAPGRRAVGELDRHLQSAAGRLAQPLEVRGVDHLGRDVEDRPPATHQLREQLDRRLRQYSRMVQENQIARGDRRPVERRRVNAHDDGRLVAVVVQASRLRFCGGRRDARTTTDGRRDARTTKRRDAAARGTGSTWACGRRPAG